MVRLCPSAHIYLNLPPLHPNHSSSSSRMHQLKVFQCGHGAHYQSFSHLPLNQPTNQPTNQPHCGRKSYPLFGPSFFRILGITSFLHSFLASVFCLFL
ncbi:hypothetical protein FA15DRAFT_297827 [Coprinopsis marcescibilis]|uniref:Uncharacterized protein n=1 Tax=Coprinopsis marcescibilis TaxID=230819 RepID=A0A5C3KDF2_COPMA|nr:hypothetical protein FA15DRAFT_297827 [Coprinopsis marcescibilis]